MNGKPERGLFVVGTGTDVGKTYVTCLLAAGLRESGVAVGVYKPVSSGCRQDANGLVSEDAEQLWEAAGRPKSLDAVSPQRFAAALAPNVAARLEGQSVNRAELAQGLAAWSDHPFVLVEGVGGLMSPVSDDDLVIDLASCFEYPMLLVVANRLGCINDCLLSLNAMHKYGLECAGIVLNDVFDQTGSSSDESLELNRAEIERLSKVPIWAHVRWNRGEEATADLLRHLPTT